MEARFFDILCITGVEEETKKNKNISQGITLLGVLITIK
jgi:hypothetical protein